MVVVKTRSWHGPLTGGWKILAAQNAVSKDLPESAEEEFAEDEAAQDD